jgi:formate--tetrahydrofolate ligase
VRAKDLKANGAMAALLKDALQPNLVQTLENNVAIIHGGPFANIAHGCSSVVATKAALKLADYVVTEGGFGADLGAEKFFNIKCRKAGLKPAAAVVVATIRALKLHGGINPKELGTENLEAVAAGMCNLERHIENVLKFKLPVVVAINHFYLDTDAEVALVKEKLEAQGIKVAVSKHWADGGAGAAELAELVVDTIATEESHFETLYPDDMSLVDKVETVAREIYRAEGITVSKEAAAQFKKITKMGYGHLPVCIAKTQYSFSNDETKYGAPTGHTIPIAEVRLSAGAGFCVCLTGSVMTMPGLPKIPASENIGVNAEGKIYGMF